MSPISIALNLLLAGLLMATLLFGWILNRRLKALKDSHAGFADAVAHLDRAAQRTETGLTELRSATDQAVDLLTSRIMKARELADNLDRLTVQGAAVLERRTGERGPMPPTPRAIAERIAAERAHVQQPAQAASAQVRSSQAQFAQTQFAQAEFAPLHTPSAQASSARYPMTTEEEALAAAETLILKLSQSEVLTSDEPPRRSAPTGPRAQARPAPGERSEFRPAPGERSEFRPGLRERPEFRPESRAAERSAAPRPDARVNPRSRAQIDDDLFEPPVRGRLRAYDGGLA